MSPNLPDRSIRPRNQSGHSGHIQLPSVATFNIHIKGEGRCRTTTNRPIDNSASPLPCMVGQMPDKNMPLSP